MRRTSTVFWASLLVVLPFVAWGAIAPESLASAADATRGFVVDRFGWFYLLTATAVLIAVIVVAASRWGKVRLGRDTDRPEYTTTAWFAMLFSAGMGIGLVFWGVAEPVSHFLTPPTAAPETTAAARDALRYSFFHWGLHPWGIYAVLAMALAYARFRRGWKATISGALRPLLGDRVDGPLGTLVDTIAVVATVFGVATSLGLGAAQVNGGLASLDDGFSIGSGTQLIIIAVVTVLFLISALSGLQRGIKWLSTANVVLAVLLFAFVLFTASTGRLVGAFTTTLGSYITELPTMSLQTGPFDAERSEWINGWTVFYWAWWISWSPFVATFIARISRGRTIREFVIGVLGVPTLVSGLWFSVFGGAGILAQQDGAELAGQATESQLFGLLDTLPGGVIAGIGAMILIVTFFVTSADSATFVLGSLSTKEGADPARSVTVVWGLVISASAAALLVSGGLAGVQTASIVAAFPFAIVLLLVLVSLVKALRGEPRLPGRAAAEAAPVPVGATAAPVAPGAPVPGDAPVTEAGDGVSRT
ncbi:BCCT family transporter [Blastococcus xanthinilyticus]|uniref:Glycine betaine transporter n=1 Tax=Blastococcus xanthinilyticus TaxID=1564164 RepID=A0A5S5D5A0_9ACTN|nr:BCCT family transporter [Blastococcus xanthinilyticus]TYP89962.1 glycine betaine transporter [Blastococcus xanthinilyticus]